MRLETNTQVRIVCDTLQSLQSLSESYVQKFHLHNRRPSSFRSGRKFDAAYSVTDFNHFLWHLKTNNKTFKHAVKRLQKRNKNARANNLPFPTRIRPFYSPAEDLLPLFEDF